jgi:hypothetical protein
LDRIEGLFPGVLIGDEPGVGVLLELPGPDASILAHLLWIDEDRLRRPRPEAGVLSVPEARTTHTQEGHTQAGRPRC